MCQHYEDVPSDNFDAMALTFTNAVRFCRRLETQLPWLGVFDTYSVGNRNATAGYRRCGRASGDWKMTDEDRFRVEAALQFGFEAFAENDDAQCYVCTEAQLIAFAKACERKSLCEARKFVRQELNNPLSARDKAPLKTIIGRLSKQIAAIDAELAPILETERCT